MPVMHIDYTHHSVNEKWKKRVKESNLSSEQKKELIKGAKKDAFIWNLEEFGWVLLQIIFFIGAMFLAYLLISWISSPK